MISIEHLNKTFGKFKALDDVSLEFEKGRTISLLGPNGSGKTTLIKSILGLVTPENGVIKIEGRPVIGQWDYRSKIGYMPQIGRYPDNMTIEQVLNMIKEIRKSPMPYDEELIDGFGIPQIKKKPMRSLSGGTRQKIGACLAFLFNPSIFILDEPTAGLDPVSSELLKDKIAKEREKGKLILITSHVLSDLEGITSHVVYLQDGKLMFYKTKEELRAFTGEESLNKAIAAIMQKKIQQ